MQIKSLKKIKDFPWKIFATLILTIISILIGIYVTSLLLNNDTDLSPEESEAVAQEEKTGGKRKLNDIHTEHIDFTHEGTFVLQGEKVHSAPTKGTWGFKESTEESPEIAGLFKQATTDKDVMLLNGSYTSPTKKIMIDGKEKEFNKRVFFIQMRFYKDKATGEWWLNSIYLRLKYNLDPLPDVLIHLISYQNAFPSSGGDVQGFYDKLSDQTIPPTPPGGIVSKSKDGETYNFMNDRVYLKIPMYRFNYKKHKMQGEKTGSGVKPWGELVFRNPMIDIEWPASTSAP